MLRYIGRRLLQMIPVFFGATLLLYALVSVSYTHLTLPTNREV